MDLHAAQIQGYFDIPFDHSPLARPSVLDYLANKQLPDIVVVSDAGGVARARAFGKSQMMHR